MRMFTVVMRMFMMMVVIMVMVSVVKKDVMQVMERFFKLVHRNLLLSKLIFWKDLPEYNVLQCIFFHRTHEILIGIELVHEFLDIRLHIIDVLDDPVGHLSLDVLFSHFQSFLFRDPGE